MTVLATLKQIILVGMVVNSEYYGKTNKELNYLAQLKVRLIKF